MLDGVCLVTSGAVARLSAPPAPASAFNAHWAGPLAAHRRAVGDLNTATHHAQLARAVLARPELFEGRLLVALGGVQVRPRAWPSSLQAHSPPGRGNRARRRRGRPGGLICSAPARGPGTRSPPLTPPPWPPPPTQGAAPHRRVAAGEMMQATQAPLAAFQVEVYLLIGLTEVRRRLAPAMGLRLRGASH
jgi:hypothetical protein